MKNLLIICLSFFVSSCASSYVTFENIEEAQKAYQQIFVVSIFNDINLKTLNRETYNDYFRDNINNIENMDSRKIMENCIYDKIANSRTLLTRSSQEFKVNVDINYSDFMQKLKESDCSAILVVNQTSYYYDVSERINSYGEIKKSESPNAVFHAYLVDAKSLQPVWVGKIYSSGTSWDYAETIYNSMSKRLNKRLIKDHFLMPPLVIHKYKY
ncbi:hypothetical protein ACT3CE_13680 [Marinifilum sp. RC60d5]|uniref:hypothetical protein n=1 Tax=Marinifilum sp. RC60d5 TaxID=3458414 RepID=UPI00403652BB